MSDDGIVIDRPIIIASLPRTGSTMLFNALAQSPSVFTIGQESHSIIEGMAALTVERRAFASSCLGAEDATPEVREELHKRFNCELGSELRFSDEKERSDPRRRVAERRRPVRGFRIGTGWCPMVRYPNL